MKKIILITCVLGLNFSANDFYTGFYNDMKNNDVREKLFHTLYGSYKCCKNIDGLNDKEDTNNQKVNKNNLQYDISCHPSFSIYFHGESKFIIDLGEFRIRKFFN